MTGLGGYEAHGDEVALTEPTAESFPYPIRRFDASTDPDDEQVDRRHASRAATYSTVVGLGGRRPQLRFRHTESAPSAPNRLPRSRRTGRWGERYREIETDRPEVRGGRRHNRHSTGLQEWSRAAPMTPSRPILSCLTVLSIVSLGWLLSIKVESPIRAPYVGSAACARCHGSIHAGWYDSLHRKMMRRASEEGALVVDLDSGGHPLGFATSDVVWVIGSKWEQQFMGHDGADETLLPGVFRRLSGVFDPVGFDGWQVPVPKQRCHGCHTVGLDPVTGEFAEPGIGCESCHGPGARHVETFGLAPIYSTADAQVCGQCHVRGQSIDGEHFFPLDYRPGDALLETVEELEPIPGRNTSSWWGNGFERKRHQEFTAWRRSAHARSLDSLREGYDGRFGQVEDACLACHSGDYILAGRRKPAVAEARFGITCAVCHQTHADLETARVACGECHTRGAFHHRTAAQRESHVPCPPEANVDCVSCHMPQVVESGGGYALHSHAGGIIPPADAERFEMPTSCANGGCHGSRETAWLQEAFEEHYAAHRSDRDPRGELPRGRAASPSSEWKEPPR